MHESRPAAVPPRRRLASRARSLAIVYFAMLFIATHIPAPSHDLSSLSDKWFHFGGYAVLTVCVLAGWELTIGVLQAKHYFAVWLVGTLYGAIDEITQIPVSRTCDVNDWAADALGIVSGMLVYRLARALLFRDGPSRAIQ
jgi:VanZ family protein